MCRKWLVVALLMLVIVISALDKTIFAFAGTHIIEELQLTPEQFGLVGSSFFFLYSVAGIAVGFVANRVATKWVLTGMSVFWVVAQLIVTFTTGLVPLIASRLLLGAATGPATAVTLHACFKWFKPQERVLPSSLIYSSIVIGGMIGAMTLPLAIDRLGWRMTYFCLAVASIAWVGLWLAFGKEGVSRDDSTSGTESNAGLPYRSLLLNRTFVSLVSLGFLCYIPAALGFSWTVVYLKTGLHLSSVESGYFMLAVTVAAMLLNLSVSAVCQRSLRNGATPYRSMIVIPLLCCGLGGLSLAVIHFVHGRIPLILTLFALGTTLVNVLPSFIMAAIAHFTPTDQRGSMLAINNAIQTSAGIVVPSVVGLLVTHSAGDIALGFEQALGIFGAATVLGVIMTFLLADPEHTKHRLKAMLEADRSLMNKYASGTTHSPSSS